MREEGKVEKLLKAYRRTHAVKHGENSEARAGGLLGRPFGEGAENGFSSCRLAMGVDWRTCLLRKDFTKTQGAGGTGGDR